MGHHSMRLIFYCTILYVHQLLQWLSSHQFVGVYSYRPLLRFKDNLKANLLSTGIDPATWEDLADNRSKWQIACLTGVQHFEEVRIVTAVEKRSQRKGSTSQSVPADKSVDTRRFICDDCGRQFTARIGLVSHSRTHRK